MTDSRGTERLQILLNAEELAALDDWRFAQRMPSRAAAVRELLRRGLGLRSDGAAAAGKRKSRDYRILSGPAQRTNGGDGSHRG